MKGEMAGKEVVVMDAWKEWGIQVLVLLSLALQVVLLVLAEFRRCVSSGTLKFLVWSAYMMADATAIYVLGHMSVISRSPEHQLSAFWAPFLLLHLGGQDNITAYAIEDNRLWLRHLQTLGVQAAAAAYVLSQSSMIAGGEQQPLLRSASILVFLVGAAKYGERVWALWSASSTGRNYRNTGSSLPGERNYERKFLDRLVEGTSGYKRARDTESHMVMAHRMLDVPRNLLRESVPEGECYRLHGVGIYKVVEMQLSLMHDIFYTKAVVIHSNWFAIFIHQISAVATATALGLFHRLAVRDARGKKEGNGGNYDRMDVAVTYALLVGAVILETVSLLRATFSSWTFIHRKRWSTARICLGHIVFLVRRLIRAADWRPRYWSASMGQHNLLQLSARSRSSRRSKVAKWLGLEEIWNTHAYSWSIPVSAFIEQSLVKQLSFERCQLNTQKLKDGAIIRRERLRDEEEGQVVADDGDDWRDEAQIKKVWALEGTADHHFDPMDPFDARVPKKLKRWGLYRGGLRRSLEERILIWHIATNIYLTWWYGNQPKEPENNNNGNNDKKKKQPKAEAYKKQPNDAAVEDLSNYMVFLLASRPGMLSPTGSRSAYVDVCYALITKRPQCETSQELAGKLLSYGDQLLNRPETSYVKPSDYGFDDEYRLPLTLQIGCKLGAMLVRKHAADTRDVIAQAWLETLCYGARDCSAYAHAKQLSSGGELITVAAILVEYLKRRAIFSL